jgi:large subunit ribosomal protein L29
MDLATAQQALAERRRTLFELRLQKERGEVKNNRQFPQLKKEVARLLQHIGELNNAADVEGEGTPDVVLADTEDEEDEEDEEE